MSAEDAPRWNDVTLALPAGRITAMLVSQGAQACPSTGETGAFYVTDFCAAAP